MREVISNGTFCDLIKQAVEQHKDYQSCHESSHEVLFQILSMPPEGWDHRD